MEIGAFRKTAHGVDDRFLNRWSPRAMSGEAIEKETLLGLFEAARWAPSSNNNQPWRFLYARRDTKLWPLFFDLLAEGNRIWAIRAAVLIVIISKTTFDFNDKPSRTHSFDAGAAWENLALQGALRGLVVHAMQGFDYDQAKETLRIPGWVSGRGDGRPRETGPKRGASGEPPGTGVPFRTERPCGCD